MTKSELILGCDYRNRETNPLLPKPEKIESYFDRLWPICRSITGSGLRESLEILKELMPLEVISTASGTRVFDWEIPPEWCVRDAFLEHIETGSKYCEFKKNNLHLVNYSVPVDRVLDFDVLKQNIHSLASLPEAVPYVTSYYSRNWGFCISENELKTMPPGKYRVYIDAEFFDEGSLEFGTCLLPANSPARCGERDTVLLSSYLCHPSLANNELSGPLALAFLYQSLKKLPNRRLNYRFVICPETIGALSYLYHFQREASTQVCWAYVLTCCGTNENFTYKRSRQKEHYIDKLSTWELDQRCPSVRKIDYFPAGSDERQYNSPGFNIPTGLIMRAPFAQYKEYHTSLDNKSLICFKSLREAVAIYLHLVCAAEIDDTYLATVVHGEPMLSKRNLYPKLGASRSMPRELELMMGLINLSDGNKSLFDIAVRLECSVFELGSLIQKLKDHDILIESKPRVSTK